MPTVAPTTADSGHIDGMGSGVGSGPTGSGSVGMGGVGGCPGMGSPGSPGVGGVGNGSGTEAVGCCMHDPYPSSADSLGTTRARPQPPRAVPGQPPLGSTV